MKNVQCPHCQKTVEWSKDFPYRPFCSERCRLIDLGAWADESYSIPMTSTPTDADIETAEFQNSLNDPNSQET